AMAAGGTLSLDADLTDVTKPILIPAGKDFTLDLKGHTISGTADFILEVQESAKLTIIDSSSGKKGAITATGMHGAGVDNYGTLEVSGGTITGNDAGVYNADILEVSGGTITATGNNGCGVYNFGILEVSGGTITSGNYTGVYNDGTLKVSGGSITGEGSSGVYNLDILEVSGGTITGNYSGVNNDGTLKVSGGSITGGSYGVNNYGTLKVSGGSITGNDAGVNNRSEEGVAFYLSGSPTITGRLVLETPVTLVGALTGSGTYTVDTGSLTDTVIAQGGSATGGTAYQITESDKGKFTVDSNALKLEGNKIVWTEQATQ
ncbi:MAG: hypothetical protein J6C11_12090, partial [Spirochaetaceae bacterium]|nr:hypothetical protein [Spirochaetaceae bacterium]